MRKIYLTSVYIGSAVFVLCYSRSLGLRCDERCVCVWGWMDVHRQGRVWQNQRRERTFNSASSK